MTILIVILILYIFLRLSGKYLFPYLLKRYLNNVKRNFESQQQQYQNTGSTQGEQKINAKHTAQKKHQDEDLIEYTEFEEIKEDQK
jgi:hypothetical protein